MTVALEHKRNKPNWLLALGLPVLVATLSCLTVLTPRFQADSILMSHAILADVLILAPFLYYLCIRKTQVSRMSILRIWVAGLLLVGLVLDSRNSIMLHYIKNYAYPIIEIAIVGALVRSFYLANKNRQTNAANTEFIAKARSFLTQVFGSEILGYLFASELAIFYYLFIPQKTKEADYQTTFTNHKESGIIGFLYALLSVVLIETLAAHLLLDLWSTTAAWITTALSLYTALQLLAHIRAISARQIRFKQDCLVICNGLAAETNINFEEIERFELSEEIPEAADVIQFSLLGKAEAHNVVLYMKTTAKVTKFFGVKKNAKILLFYTDRPADFAQVLSLRIGVCYSN